MPIVIPKRHPLRRRQSQALRAAANSAGTMAITGPFCDARAARLAAATKHEGECTRMPPHHLRETVRRTAERRQQSAPPSRARPATRNPRKAPRKPWQRSCPANRTLHDDRQAQHEDQRGQEASCVVQAIEAGQHPRANPGDQQCSERADRPSPRRPERHVGQDQRRQRAKPTLLQWYSPRPELGSHSGGSPALK